MAKVTIQAEDISFRAATVDDAKVASGLIYATFPKVATFTVGLGSEERAKMILAKLFVLPEHRWSYEETVLAIHQGRVVGALLACPASRLRKLDRRTDKLVLRQYRMKGKIALIVRTWPLIFMKDVKRQDYVIGNLAVRSRYRGKGIGGVILAYAEEQAREAGLKRMVLRVAIENKIASSLYEKAGFTTRAMYLESNKRVKVAGAGYRWMVKDLTS